MEERHRERNRGRKRYRKERNKTKEIGRVNKEATDATCSSKHHNANTINAFCNLNTNCDRHLPLYSAPMYSPSKYGSKHMYPHLASTTVNTCIHT